MPILLYNKQIFTHIPNISYFLSCPTLRLAKSQSIICTELCWKHNRSWLLSLRMAALIVLLYYLCSSDTPWTVDGGVSFFCQPEYNYATILFCAFTLSPANTKLQLQTRHFPMLSSFVFLFSSWLFTLDIFTPIKSNIPLLWPGSSADYF